MEISISESFQLTLTESNKRNTMLVIPLGNILFKNKTWKLKLFTYPSVAKWKLY